MKPLLSLLTVSLLATGSFTALNAQGPTDMPPEGALAYGKITGIDSASRTIRITVTSVPGRNQGPGSDMTYVARDAFELLGFKVGDQVQGTIAKGNDNLLRFQTLILAKPDSVKAAPVPAPVPAAPPQ